MRTIPAGFLDRQVTDLQVCWRVTRRDGEQILGTEYDQNILITDRRPTPAPIWRTPRITGSDIRSHLGSVGRQPGGDRRAHRCAQRRHQRARAICSFSI